MVYVTLILWLVVSVFGYQTDTNVADALHAITNKCIDHDAHKECNDYATEALSSCSPGDSQCQSELIIKAYEFCREICGTNDYLSDATREFLEINGQSHFLASYGGRSNHGLSRKPAADPNFIAESNTSGKKKRSLRDTVSSKVVELATSHSQDDEFLEPSYDYEMFYDGTEGSWGMYGGETETTSPGWDQNPEQGTEQNHLTRTPELYSTPVVPASQGWDHPASVSVSFVTIYETVTATITETPLLQTTPWPNSWSEPTNTVNDYWKYENENRQYQQYYSTSENYGAYHDTLGYYYHTESPDKYHGDYYYDQPTTTPMAPWANNVDADPNFGKRLRHLFKLNAALENQSSLISNSSVSVRNSTGITKARLNATSSRNYTRNTSNVLRNAGFCNTVKSPAFIIIFVTLFMLIIY